MIKKYIFSTALEEGSREVLEKSAGNLISVKYDGQYIKFLVEIKDEDFDQVVEDFYGPDFTGEELIGEGYIVPQAA